MRGRVLSSCRPGSSAHMRRQVLGEQASWFSCGFSGVSEAGVCVACAIERGLSGRPGGRNVSHLPAGARRLFSVQIQPDARLSKHTLERRRSIGPQITEEVHDRGGLKDRWIAQRQIAHGAYELLELAG